MQTHTALWNFVDCRAKAVVRRDTRNHLDCLHDLVACRILAFPAALILFLSLLQHTSLSRTLASLCLMSLALEGPGASSLPKSLMLCALQYLSKLDQSGEYHPGLTRLRGLVEP